MFWITARAIYEKCRSLGLCRSQRDFSQRLLGRGPHYLRLVSNRQGFTSERTNRTLQRRLYEAWQITTASHRSEISRILADVERGEEMARWLRRRA